jgi:hypothetical protein
MTLTIELTPEIEKRLEKEASRQGIQPQEFALKLIEIGLPPTPAPSRQYEATAALFKKWEEEDRERLARMTPEEIAAEDAAGEEVIQNLRQNRVDFPVPDMSDHA